MANTSFGAILVNVTSLELTIVDLKTGQQLERVTSAVAIGENIYNHEDIQLQNVADAAAALRGFIQILKDDGVTNYQA